jgi:cytochrome P450
VKSSGKRAYRVPRLERRPTDILPFRTGIHCCLRHQLARMEAKCALLALFTRWPNRELAVAESKVRWWERPGLRAIANLPVKADPG